MKERVLALLELWSGPASRVATVNPCTAAMAAIWPSAIEIARPGARARLTSPAYIVAAC